MRNFLFILLIIQPLIVKISRVLGLNISVINELVSLAVLAAFLIIIIWRKRVNSSVVILVSFVGYLFLLGLFRGIMPLSLLQILIYSQFFFYFFLFQTFSARQKRAALVSLKNIMSYTLILIAVIAVWEYADHQSWRDLLGVHTVKRGINEFYLISFFGSGPSLAIFITLYVVLWHYVHYALEVPTKRIHRVAVFTAVILACLTFSRKEVLLTFLFLVFFPYPARSKLNKWVKRLVLFISGFVGLIVYYFSFFESANARSFDSEYIRWKIITRSAEIYGDHFPFGTGAGTFGSRVSLMMPDIYEEYGIGQDMLGWRTLGNTGPIYDSFLFTFTTEVGIGLFIFLFFFYKLYEARTLSKSKYAGFCKNFLVLFFVALALFVPMVTNTFGFMIMIMIACMIPPLSMVKYRRWSLKNIKI